MIPRACQRESVWLIGLAALACGEPSSEQLPPLGEVVVFVDTDAPVPDFVDRLRVDLFDETGRWLESRDIARTSAADWPASFSLFTRDEKSSRQVLVRARGYLEGRVRDYHGESFQDRAPYVEPWAADTLPELCADVPELVLGQELTLRRGTRTLTGYVQDPTPDGAPSDWIPECGIQMVGGAVAARLNVQTAGEYRLETTNVRPTGFGAGDTNLFIRSDCRDAASQIACADDISRDAFAPNYLARLVVQLEPGSYTVISGAYVATPSDVTLRADLAANWDDAPAAPPEEPLGSLPRLVSDDVDVTPRQEPEPLVTIDRLALVTLVPGQKQSASIVLRTACAGQMAKLSGAASDAEMVLAEAESCIDTEGQRLPVIPEVLSSWSRTPPPSLGGTFVPGDPCPEGAATGGAVCIPAGTFVFGSPVHRSAPLGTTPEHLAVMNRFWLDETEVTVGRWRAALASGFESPNGTPIENDGPLGEESYVSYCTFGSTPMVEPREDFPLTCVDWQAARAFCRFEGGDLPTEAQWQYAVSRAGQSYEVDELCDQAAPSNSEPAPPSACQLGTRTKAVTDPSLAVDVTALGVRSLIGNVSEWSLDGFYALDEDCWNGASLTDPLCWEENAPLRTAVGGSWQNPYNAWRFPVDPLGDIYSAQVNLGVASIGFRCAYPDEPR
jgi:formylglycine-generating enzyme required for sulfatase activity